MNSSEIDRYSVHLDPEHDEGFMQYFAPVSLFSDNNKTLPHCNALILYTTTMNCDQGLESKKLDESGETPNSSTRTQSSKRKASEALCINVKIDRFEPRGDTKAEEQSDAVKNYYDPSDFDCYLFKSIIPQLLRIPQERGTEVKVEYLGQNTDGIMSNDQKTFPQSKECAKLVFSYLKIRDQMLHNRDEALKKWKSDEKVIV